VPDGTMNLAGALRKAMATTGLHRGQGVPAGGDRRRLTQRPAGGSGPFSGSQRLISQPSVRENELRTGRPCQVPMSVAFYGQAITLTASWTGLDPVKPYLGYVEYPAVAERSSRSTRGSLG
jgi:hypothetical protein